MRHAEVGLRREMTQDIYEWRSAIFYRYNDIIDQRTHFLLMIVAVRLLNLDDNLIRYYD